ncbi:aspartyl-tRNA(Asn)/glutamyl-tRNA(Gln) amidotransferase subunit C [Propionibacterium cyclohexanicum]|uniref:Aspartyl/glutamyl-tRNA(Asn/Gln) amidotransferase subunit C n=1 Tax=Propionibacterium cyclohexanicum TaxID=64702 RepID=A0A1H9R1Q6_9ACTN|nr:aspartyl-tRNA(Asn)/glutamyl-tRNA(Gln) amidotransferase subunit C [Propionibacterium cyclohexanicum]
MAVSPQDVSRLADLARIELTDQELAELAPQIDVILDAVASVSEVADLDIAPISHAVQQTNVMREDICTPSFAPEAMLAGAPAVVEQRFRVPRIIDDSNAQ